MFAKESTRSKQDQRRLKHGISAEEQRRKREEVSNEIRKSKREEGLQKRRNFGITEAPTEDVPLSLEILPQCVAAIYSVDVTAQLQAVVYIRKSLSIGTS